MLTGPFSVRVGYQRKRSFPGKHKRWGQARKLLRGKRGRHPPEKKEDRDKKEKKREIGNGGGEMGKKPYDDTRRRRFQQRQYMDRPGDRCGKRRDEGSVSFPSPFSPPFPNVASRCHDDGPGKWRRPVPPAPFSSRRGSKRREKKGNPGEEGEKPSRLADCQKSTWPCCRLGNLRIYFYACLIV